MNWRYISQKTALFIVTVVKTSDITWHYPDGLSSGGMCVPVRYELGFYIPQDGIIHSHRRENLKSYTAIIG
jgi:hypothetical protein